MNKYLLIATVIAAAGCSTTPINHTAAQANAVRQCRVTAAVQKQYPIDAMGNVRLINVAYAKCMQAKGYGVREG